MRHKVKKRLGIGKDAKHRKALLCNLALVFLSREYLKTTVAKAKLFRGFIEKLITKARTDSLHNRRMVYRSVRDTRILKKLFIDIAKRYIDRPGGYTRIRRLGFRKGDGSELALIQLVSADEDLSVDTNEVKEAK